MRELPAGLQPLRVRMTAAIEDEPDAPPLRVWRPGPGRPFSARLHQLDDHLGYYADGIAAFRVDPRRSTVEVSPCGPRSRWEPRLWGIPSVACFLRSGDVSLHAAAVDVGGRALVFPAPSRHGKTTLAAAFQQAGHRVLGEDLVRCRTSGPAAAYPGPAMLRVRPDVAQRLGAVRSASPRTRDADRIHFELAAPCRGDGAAVPLGGIVLLSLGEGPVRLDRVDPAAAISALWPLSFHLPTDAGRARCFGGLARLVDAVAVWRLTRPLRFDDLPQVIERLARCLDSDA